VSRANDMAYPTDDQASLKIDHHMGLTIREHFAAMAHSRLISLDYNSQRLIRHFYEHDDLLNRMHAQWKTDNDIRLEDIPRELLGELLQMLVKIKIASSYQHRETIAAMAVAEADALIAELAKPKELPLDERGFPVQP
jgi:hypothetical protein